MKEQAKINKQLNKAKIKYVQGLFEASHKNPTCFSRPFLKGRHGILTVIFLSTTCPGLNPQIRAIYNKAEAHEYDLVGAIV